MGLGFHTQCLGVLGMGFGCGYETHSQNPNPIFIGCECMHESPIFYEIKKKVLKKNYFDPKLESLFIQYEMK